MIEVDKIDKNFVPTIEWMENRYNEMNRKLFGNYLGECNFSFYSNSKSLGSFCTTNRNSSEYKIMVWKDSRQMFIRLSSGICYDINRSNFFSYCNPTIYLNNGYRGTEYGFLSTLVHEMCHYYTYMNGYSPKQAHGKEFKAIGKTVEFRSNGLFTIQRLATAEEMEHYEMGSEMKQKLDDKNERLKNRMNVVFLMYGDDFAHLFMTTSLKTFKDFISYRKYYNDNFDRAIICHDNDFINYLFNLGYKNNFRSINRYYAIRDKNILDMLKDSNMELEIIENVRESNMIRRNDTIISEVINNFINEVIFDDSEEFVVITSDMDLGQYSPLEL